MSKRGPHPIVECPYCHKPAQLNYKNRPKLGKCTNPLCHRQFWYVKKLGGGEDDKDHSDH